MVELRNRAAARRDAAGEQREEAALDRFESESDRSQAAKDREQAAEDRHAVRDSDAEQSAAEAASLSPEAAPAQRPQRPTTRVPPLQQSSPTTEEAGRGSARPATLPRVTVHFDDGASTAAAANDEPQVWNKPGYSPAKW